MFFIYLSLSLIDGFQVEIGVLGFKVGTPGIMLATEFSLREPQRQISRVQCE